MSGMLVIRRVGSGGRWSRGWSRASSRVDAVVGVLASAGLVALVTALIAVLERWLPVLALGSLYVLAVLPISVLWGLAAASVVGVVSTLAFNFFFLDPRHTLHLREGANWVVLAIYLVVALTASELAARARRRAVVAERRERETGLLAALASQILRSGSIRDELDAIGPAVASVVGASHSWIVLEGDLGPPGTERLPLVAGGRDVGAVHVLGGVRGPSGARQRFLSALAALVAVAVDRERMQEESVETEALRRSDAVKTMVLRGVSHDLRTPLTAIRAAVGSLGAVGLRLSDEDRLALTSTIAEASERLQRQVDDLLDLSKLQAGSAAPARELWAVEEVVSLALSEFDERTISASLAEDLPPVYVDASQIRRALVNVIENALRHGGDDVRVTVVAEADVVAIRVADRGPGVPQSDAESLFAPFARGRTPAAGTGLGLAIARGFAELNEGTLRFEPVESGAVVTLLLPTEPGDSSLSSFSSGERSNE